MARDLTRFAELFEMAEHGPDVWVANSARYPWIRVYGGQVAAQGLWAAAQTVGPDHRPHSLHAYFIRGGDADEPIRFEVDRIRDGRSFVTRRVVARQSNGAILNLAASFHVDEDAPDVAALSYPPDVVGPDGLPDMAWGPMLDRRPVPYEQNRARTWLRVAGPLGDDPLVHTVAHVYASDDLATEAVEIEHPRGRPDYAGDYGPDTVHPYMGASLDHTVWFHRPAPADVWNLHDFRSSGVAGSRGLAFGEIWGADGTHVASIAQEVLLREVDPSRSRGQGWGS